MKAEDWKKAKELVGQTVGNARLELFRTVRAAVSFAHRNLIVYCDLKRSNILVSGDGNVKLLDFGISKIISTELGNIYSATITRLGVMTPGYASPEQLRNKSVTTATDVYSLGVILYELLSGHRPFEAREKDLKQFYEAVTSDEPPPSSVVETVSKFTNTPTKLKFGEDSEFSNGDSNRTKANNSSNTAAQTVGVKPQFLRGDCPAGERGNFLADADKNLSAEIETERTEYGN